MFLRVYLSAALILAILDFLLEGLGLNPYFGLGITAAVFLLGRLWRKKRAVPLCIPAFALCLITAFRLDRQGGDVTISGLCALLVLLGYLLSMHAQGMDDGLHNMPGERPMAWPRGVRGKNILMVLVFLGFALGLASIGAAQRVADRLLHAAVTRAESAYNEAAERIKTRTMPNPSPLPSGKPAPTPSPSPEPEPEPTEEPEFVPVSPFMRALLTAFTFTSIPLAILALVGYLIYALVRRGPGDRGGLLGLLTRLRRRERENGELYIEEQDKLRSWQSIRDSARRRLRPRRRAAQKKQFRDLPDDPARVRYAWLCVQTSSGARKCGSGLTPRELGEALGAEEYRDLAEQYNLVRYAPGKPLAPNAGELAYAALRSLERR